MISIFRKDQNGEREIFKTPINEGCNASGKLMESCSINLKFSTETPIEFKVGDYVDLSRHTYTDDDETIKFPAFVKMKYVLKESQYPTFNQTTGGYDYDLKFVAFYEAWGNMVYKFAIGIRGQETKWSYTGTIREHLAIFLKNIKVYAENGNHIFKDFLDEQKQRLGITSDGYDGLNEENVFYVEDGKKDLSGVTTTTPSYIDDRHVFLSFDGTKMSDVFKTLCSEENFDCDFWYDPVARIFKFGRCEDGSELDLNPLGDSPNCQMSAASASGDFANRLFCYGSEKNLTARYRRDMEFEVRSITYNGNEYEKTWWDYDYVDEFDVKDYCKIFADTRNPIGEYVLKNSKKELPFSKMLFNDYANTDESIKPLEELGVIGAGNVVRYNFISQNFTFNSGNNSTIDIEFNLSVAIDAALQKSNDNNESIAFYITFFVERTIGREFADDPESKEDELIPYPRVCRTLYFVANKEANGIGSVVDKTPIRKEYSNIRKDVIRANVKKDDVSIRENNILDNKIELVQKNSLSYYGKETFVMGSGKKIEDPVNEQYTWSITIETGVLSNLVDYYNRPSGGADVIKVEKGVYYLSAQLGIPQRKGTCDLIIDGETYKDAVVVNARHESGGRGLDEWLCLKKEFSNIKDKIVKGTKFRLGNILSGRLPIDFFSQETKGNEYAVSVLNRNLLLPERFYLKYNQHEEDGLMVYDDIEYSMNGGEGFKEYNNEYIDIYDNSIPSEIVEKTQLKDDIFPKMGDAQNNGEKVLQVGLDKIVKDDDTAYEVGKTHYQYAFNTLWHFSQDALLPEKDLRVRFTSGAMNGMEFDVNFYDYESSYKCEEDGTVLYNDKTKGQHYLISPNEDYGVELPNDVIFPKAEDRFILIGFDPTALDGNDGMVENAEVQLLDYAVKMANQIRNNTATYTATLFVDEYTSLDDYYIGRKAKVVDMSNLTKRTSRVIGYNICLDIPYDHPQFTIGQSVEYSRLRSIENYAGTKSDGRLN